LLWRTKAVPDAKVFYCPGNKRAGNNWVFDYYATVPNLWPSTPPASGDDNVRTGYNYYPPLRDTENVSGYDLPRLSYAKAQLEYGGTLEVVAPMKQSALNPSKSVSADLVHNIAAAPHQIRGAISGMNVLFGDGHVTWQNARGNPQAFDPVIWTDVGSNPLNFRRLMDMWRP
jgi:prepilin-type processing-associated H-X9-DG protein